ncbi:hypothetical protein QYF36_008685 [Acer negundo]|nr:hypothetical protein QYF36_008685 [Acer negundo]
MKSPAKVKPKPVEPAISIARLGIRVGKSIKAQKYPDIDLLYVEEIYVGERQSQTLVSGLVKYIPLEEMQPIASSITVGVHAMPFNYLHALVLL